MTRTSFSFAPAGTPTYGEFQMEEGFGLPDD
jgi:hypothetical protein